MSLTGYTAWNPMTQLGPDVGPVPVGQLLADGMTVVPKDVNVRSQLPRNIHPQAYKDQSSDNRKGLKSFFSTGKRAVEKDAYEQAHLSASGISGVVNLAVLNHDNKPIPYAPFEWGGREYCTDANGVFKLVEKKYFENSISAENERVKYTTQMISLVVGQPAQNVIAMFGYNFYVALSDGQRAIELYRVYLSQAGIPAAIAERKLAVFVRYADADCSPEIMCNFGDNDPLWSKAFNKLSMLIEFHPSAILFDEGPPNPLISTGKLEGDTGAHNHGNLSDQAMANVRWENTRPDLHKNDASKFTG